MKTVTLTDGEQVTLLSALKIVNEHHRTYLADSNIRKGVKDRIRLFRKLVKLYNIRGDQYHK